MMVKVKLDCHRKMSTLEEVVVAAFESVVVGIAS